MSITILSISFILNMVYSVRMYPILMSLNKTVLQTINKSFETIHLDAKVTQSNFICFSSTSSSQYFPRCNCKAISNFCNAKKLKNLIPFLRMTSDK